MTNGPETSLIYISKKCRHLRRCTAAGDPCAHSQEQHLDEAEQIITARCEKKRTGQAVAVRRQERRGQLAHTAATPIRATRRAAHITTDFAKELTARIKDRVALKAWNADEMRTARPHKLDTLTKTPTPYRAPSNPLYSLAGKLSDGRTRIGEWAGAYDLRPQPLLTTSRGVGALSLGGTDPNMGDSGILHGYDPDTRTPFIIDAFAQYGMNVKVGNEIVYGDTGYGKTTYLTTKASRYARAGYYVFTIGTKPQAIRLPDGTEVTVDEWVPVINSLKLPVITMSHEGGTVINPLDRRFSKSTDSKNRFNNHELVTAIIEAAARERLDAHGRAALTVAIDRAYQNLDDQRKEARTSLNRRKVAASRAQAARRIEQLMAMDPTLKDVHNALGEPTAEDAAALYTDVETLKKWGEKPRLILNTALRQELAGLCDGQTDIRIDVDAQWIHADLSDMDAGGLDVTLAVMLLGAFLRNIWLARRPGRQGQKRRHLLITDESWHIWAIPAIATIFREFYKYWRALGLINVGATHRPNDHALTPEAQAIIAETGVLSCFHLKAEHARMVAEVHELSPADEACIPGLGTGTYLNHITGLPEGRVIFNQRSQWEIDNSWSNYAMVGENHTLTNDAWAAGVDSGRTTAAVSAAEQAEAAS